MVRQGVLGGPVIGGDFSSVSPNNVNVQTATVYEGTKALGSSVTTNSIIGRSLATELTGAGVVYVSMYRNNSNTGSALATIAFFRNSSGANRFAVFLSGATGNMGGDLAGAVVLADYSLNTWYTLRITYDMSANTYTVAYSTDAYGTVGTFSSESATYTMSNSGAVTGISLRAGTHDRGFIDYISSETPFVEPPPPPPPAPTGYTGLFANPLASTSELIAGVGGSVQETGENIWPLFALVGIPIAFIFGRKLIVFVRRSIG